MIRTECASAAELRLGGCRLDGWYYSSEGARAWRAIESTEVRVDALSALCVLGGLYIPHRFKRPYVRDPKYGIPYITGSSISLADPLQNCAYLSSRPGAIPGQDSLMLKPGTILVTASGIPGIAVYVNDLFLGTVGSPDLVRVLPDTAQVRPGYLYSFLSSPVGRGMLARGTYGGVIPHIEAEHIADLPIPRLAARVEEAIHERVEVAATKRVETNWKLREADLAYLALVELPEPPDDSGRPRCFSANIDDGLLRFDAPHYHPQAMWVRRALNAHPWKRTVGEITLQVFHPFRMNIRYVEPEDGIPFINGGDIIDARPKPVKWISRRLYKDSPFVVKRGWSLATNAGTIGFDAYVGRSLDGFTMAQHVTRFIPNEDEVLPEFLYAIIRSPFTRVQMRSLIYGSVVDTVLEGHMASMLTVCPDKDRQREVACLIGAAIELRDQANDLEDEAQAMLERALDDSTGGAWSKLVHQI
jgi:type I restriction enzyme, S subunit